MAKTLRSDGHTITITAGGTILSGDVDDIGDLIGVALNGAATGELVTYAISGVWDMPATVADTFAIGDEVGIVTGEIAALGTGSYAMEAGTSLTVIAVLINGIAGSGG